MRKTTDEKISGIIGQRFGRLVVLGRTEDKIVCYNGKKYRRRMVECQCDCGNIVSVRYDMLTDKKRPTRSCGCLQRDITAERLRNTHNVIYGDSRERIHNIWYLIIERCNNPDNSAYHNYGGRGIKVCPEWDDGIKGYFRFKEWSLNNGYAKDLSIDRIDNDKGYSPDNCRWATVSEQANNKRNNVILEFNGRSMTLSQWAREIGMPMKVLHARIIRYGWDVERALTQPVRKSPSKKESQ